MKKTIMAMIVIACLMVISLSTVALSHIQATGSMKARHEKSANDANRWPATEPTMGSSNQQAPKYYVTGHSDRVDDSCRTLSEQTSNKNESTAWPTEANQTQASDLPAPLPDGRIFLYASAGTEDPIPYIPTEDPKIVTGVPIVPPELDTSNGF